MNDDVIQNRYSEIITVDPLIVVVDKIIVRLRTKYLLYRPYWTERSVDMGGIRHAKFMGSMPNKDGDLVGTIRTDVYKKNGDDQVSILIDWKLDGFGFWYRKHIVISEQGMDVLDRQIKEIAHDIGTTSRGSVRIKSSNLNQKKIKLNKSYDETFDYGMRLY